MWTQLILELASDDLTDRVSAEVWSWGAIGVEIRDGATFSDFDQSRFSQLGETAVLLIAYFPPDTPVSLVERVQLLGPEVRLVELSSFHERSWQTDWRQFFEPTRVSPRVTIRPTWDDHLPPGEHEVVLVVDPQMAFGTGTHETTRMCIQELDRLLTARPDRRVIDVGSGSGILVMCAQRLGASQAVGIDIDPVAVEVASDNWQLNGLGDAAQAPFSTRPLARIEETFEVVVANMLSSTLSDLRDDLVRIVQPGGHLIATGILKSEADRFTPAFAGSDLVVKETRSDGEWILVHLVKP